VATAVLAWTAAARAQPDRQGAACETSYECGELHCVEGTCVAIEDGKAVDSTFVAPKVTSGSSAMFGDGTGYVVPIIIADVSATAAAGVLVALAVATGQGGFGVAALFPTTLVAPILHAAYGRPVPALISFLGWASVPPTSVFFAALTAFGGTSSGTWLLTGTAIAGGAAIGLTALDAYFARPVNMQNEHPSSVTWAPAIAPTPGGFMASVAGTF